MQVDELISFQINVCTTQDIHLCGHPHWAYLLKAIEENYKLKTIICLFGNLNERTTGFYDYTRNEIKINSEIVASKTVVFRDDYPFFTPDIWKQILHAENSIVFKLGDKEILSVKVNNTEVTEVIQLVDKYNQLHMEDPIDLIVVETLIKNDFFPYHPVRLKPPYKILKSQNNKPELLFSAPYDFFPAHVKSMFEDKFNITYAFNAPTDVTVQLLNKAEIWITGTCPPYYIDNEIFGQAKNLKIMASPSTGTNHINVKQAENHGIKICSIKTSDFLKNIHASSEHTFALLLAMVKKIPLVTYRAKLGEWREKEHEFRSIELNGRTIGIVGYGRIGSNLARYCHAFGMKILAYDPFKTITESFVTQISNREELLKNAEIVSINYHLSPETVNSFGKPYD